MTLAQTYSWLFYAVALASRTEPAKFRDIEQVADGINHAIPTQKEMRESLAWLTEEGLINKEGKAFLLSNSGTELLNKLSNSAGTTMGVWKNIEKHFEEYGVDNANNINPNTLAT
jgi:hypothetical protein